MVALDYSVAMASSQILIVSIMIESLHTISITAESFSQQLKVFHLHADKKVQWLHGINSLLSIHHK